MTDLDILRAPVLGDAAHGFFGRLGGVSAEPYASLNCGPGSADSPDAVAENRARVAARMGAAPEALLTAAQVHGTRALVVDGPWEGERPEADALVARAPGVVVSALTADCAPVLFADDEAGVVAAAHAGWRGALDGVLEAALDAMESVGADRARVAAAIGPCISQRAYEVGPEFVERFLDDDAENARFFAGGAGDRAQFDLPGFCLRRLRKAGVGAAEWVGRCSHDEPRRFFSHRRSRREGASDYGRMIAAIRAG